MEGQLICLQCFAEEKKIKSSRFHSILCEKAKKEEIELAGHQHVTNFSNIWKIVLAKLQIRNQ